MTKPGLSLLAVLLDRSSSARPAADAIRSGVDALLSEQRERPGELLVTLASRSAAGQETACALRPVAEVGPVECKPRGESALHEGIVTLIDDVGTELAGLEESERPERVVLVLVGDCAADGSDAERVRELVERQRRDYAWEFVLVDVASGAGGPTAGPHEVAGERAGAAPVHGIHEPHRNGVGADQDPGDEIRPGVPAEADAPAADLFQERSDVLTTVGLAEARLGVPATAAIVAGPGPDGVRAGLVAASAFVSRARETRPWEPVEGFTEDERTAASVAAPVRPVWWRRLLGLGG